MIAEQAHKLFLIQIYDFVAFFERIQTVGDDHHREFAGKCLKGGDKGVFGVLVEVACGFIEYQKFDIAVEGAGDTDALTLSA